MASLSGKVAVVAGATRGAGRGIARALGEAGAVVYCTGRSVRGEPSPYGRPETIEETAEMVTAAGGAGIAVRVDHTDEEQVRVLFERVAREQGGLDVLANNVAGTDMRMAGWGFWQIDLKNAAVILDNALLSHVITAKHAAPLMTKQRRGLIVEITEFDLLFCGGNVVAQLVKFSLKGLAVMLAEELRKHRVAVVALTPGFLRAEFMLEHFKVTEENWRDGAKRDENFLESESPLFVGRAVAALAADPKVMRRTGTLTSSYGLAREYGFTDYDGRRPDFGEHFARVGFMREPLRRHIEWLEGLKRTARGYLGEGEAAACEARSTDENGAAHETDATEKTRATTKKRATNEARVSRKTRAAATKPRRAAAGGARAGKGAS